MCFRIKSSAGKFLYCIFYGFCCAEPVLIKLEKTMTAYELYLERL